MLYSVVTELAHIFTHGVQGFPFHHIFIETCLVFLIITVLTSIKVIIDWDFIYIPQMIGNGDNFPRHVGYLK